MPSKSRLAKIREERDAELRKINNSSVSSADIKAEQRYRVWNLYRSKLDKGINVANARARKIESLEARIRKAQDPNGQDNNTSRELKAQLRKLKNK